jgi:hypothetical protein
MCKPSKSNGADKKTFRDYKSAIKHQFELDEQ